MNAVNKKSLCAVVTTFESDKSLSHNLLMLSEHVSCIILVDDSGLPNVTDITLDIVPNLIHLRNTNNSGIAYSLNKGVNKAILNGFKWILTLDDDTVVDDDYVDNIIKFLIDSRVENIGLICGSRELNNDEYFQIKRNVITSGSIFNVKVFLDSGGFSEELFIDLVDFDFCTRVRSKGYQIVQLSNVSMKHKVGNSNSLNILGVSVIVYNHAPFRLYYQVRNPFLFFNFNYKKDFLLSSYILLNPIKILLKTVVFEKQKTSRLKYIFKGFKDGLLKRGGKLND